MPASRAQGRLVLVPLDGRAVVAVDLEDYKKPVVTRWKTYSQSEGSSRVFRQSQLLEKLVAISEQRSHVCNFDNG